MVITGNTVWQVPKSWCTKIKNTSFDQNQFDLKLLHCEGRSLRNFSQCLMFFLSPSLSLSRTLFLSHSVCLSVCLPVQGVIKLLENAVSLFERCEVENLSNEFKEECSRLSEVWLKTIKSTRRKTSLKTKLLNFAEILQTGFRDRP